MLESFDKAFERCVMKGAYPSPYQLNTELGRTHVNMHNLNGREVKRRRELMLEHGIDLRRAPR